MISVKSEDLWVELQKLSSESKNVKAAVAYVSDDTVIAFGDGDILVVDASDSSVAAGKTSAQILERAFNRGAKLYSCDTLHGKVIVFDSTSYIGSSNISSNSKNNLDEIGMFTDQPSVMSESTQIIHELAKESIEINEVFIRRILGVEVKTSPSNYSKPKNVKIQPPHTWLVSLRNDAKFPGDEESIEQVNNDVNLQSDEERAWFWMKPNNSFFDSANVGDSVVIIDRDESDAEEPERAYRHFTIQDITFDTEVNIKAYHYAFTDQYEISWKDFQELADKSNITRLGKGLSNIRKLTEKQSNILFQMWS